MKIRVVSKADFSQMPLQLMAEIEMSGETLIVTEDGKPVLEMRRYRGGNFVAEDLRGTVLQHTDPLEPVPSPPAVQSPPAKP